MPRRARSMRDSDYMHVIVRGIGKQLLFEEPNDYRHYLNRLERYCLQTKVKVIAYCLMENHVHLLLNGKSSAVALLMKKIGVSYSAYFNRKYDRVGHLFQDRYLSEPVENEKYLLTVFRYILQNPQNAGICQASGYPWSSYPFYEGTNPEFIDFSVIKLLLGDQECFEKFVSCDSEISCLEYEKNRHDDEWAKNEIRTCLGIPAGTKIQGYSRAERDFAIAKLIERGLSIRQIERLTGISRGVIQRVGKRKT